MRQIGTIPRDVDPRNLVDYLLAQGISVRVDERPEGRLVWVMDEDHLPAARQELDEFLKQPGAPKYHDAERVAREKLLEADRLEREYRKNFRDLSGHWDRSSIGRQPLTTALIAISAVVFLLQKGFPQWHVYERLAFSNIGIDQLGRMHPMGLTQILHGEVWRLVTPIFLHFGYSHILFNMWALWVLGSVIEARRGTATLALLVFTSALLPNLGQFLYDTRFGHPLSTFGGMSGVVYALFGYLWMKGNTAPEQGMRLPPSTVQIMLIWLVLCFTGMFGRIANAVHVVGLVVGIILGLAGL